MDPHQYLGLLDKCLVLYDVGSVGDSTILLTGPEEKRGFISGGKISLLEFFFLHASPKSKQDI